MPGMGPGTPNELSTSHILDLIVEVLQFHGYGRTLEVRTLICASYPMLV
jgi:hypothetical protein